jgi:hypothetical protein
MHMRPLNPLCAKDPLRQMHSMLGVLISQSQWILQTYQTLNCQGGKTKRSLLSRAMRVSIGQHRRQKHALHSPMYLRSAQMPSLSKSGSSSGNLCKPWRCSVAPGPGTFDRRPDRCICSSAHACLGAVNSWRMGGLRASFARIRLSVCQSFSFADSTASLPPVLMVSRTNSRPIGVSISTSMGHSLVSPARMP